MDGEVNMKPTLTMELARAAGTDAANRAMRAEGRTSWSLEDYQKAVEEFIRLWPEKEESDGHHNSYEHSRCLPSFADD